MNKYERGGIKEGNGQTALVAAYSLTNTALGAVHTLGGSSSLCPGSWCCSYTRRFFQSLSRLLVLCIH